MVYYYIRYCFINHVSIKFLECSVHQLIEFLGIRTDRTKIINKWHQIYWVSLFKLFNVSLRRYHQPPLTWKKFDASRKADTWHRYLNINRYIRKCIDHKEHWGIIENYQELNNFTGGFIFCCHPDLLACFLCWVKLEIRCLWR